MGSQETNENNFLVVAKSNLQPLKKVLSLQVLIIALYFILKPNLIQILVIANGISIILMAYPAIKNRTKFNYVLAIKTIIKNSILISILWWLFSTFSAYGFWGLFFVIILYSIYVLYKNRKQYVNSINQVFKLLYGKEVKDFKKKGDFKKRKSRIGKRG